MSGALKALRADGFGFVCSTCKKLTRQLDKGQHGRGCEEAIAQRHCGGPITGLSFPLYEGALTKQTIAMTCFVCGMSASKILQAQDGGYIGCCNEHMKMVSIKEEKFENVRVMRPVHDPSAADPVEEA